MEQAKQSFSLETWYKYTYSTLNLSQYIQSDENGKAKMVFDSMCDGLRLIADFDHLDKEKIEDVINYIDKNGIDMELTYTIVQTYLSISAISRI